MKKFIALALTSLVLAACQSSTQPVEEEGVRLATDQDMQAIYGKTLTYKPGFSFVISQNGTMSGSWGGGSLEGTFEMRDGYFCRVLTQSPRGPMPEDCQLFILEGDSLTGTRDRGNGVSFTYTVS